MAHLTPQSKVTDDNVRMGHIFTRRLTTSIHPGDYKSDIQIACLCEYHHKTLKCIWSIMVPLFNAFSIRRVCR